MTRTIKKTLLLRFPYTPLSALRIPHSSLRLPRPAASHTAAMDATDAHASRPPVTAVIRLPPPPLSRTKTEISASPTPSPSPAVAHLMLSSPLPRLSPPPQVPPATLTLSLQGGSRGGPKESYPAVLLLPSHRPTIYYLWCCAGREETGLA